MPRLLVEGKWYEAVSSQSWYEGDFQTVVVNQAENLFARWICVPFHETVEGANGARKRPDLALIDEHYREWWVVEIELAHHDLTNHVLPQVEAFRTGSYDAKHAQALARGRAGLDVDRLSVMMSGDPPGVMVVVDSPAVVAEWRPALAEHAVGLGVVEPFRDANNRLILRLNGDQPEPPGSVLTRCSRHASLRRLWKVHSPAALPVTTSEVLTIEYEGIISEWSRIELLGSVLLKPIRGDVLTGVSRVELVRRDDNTLLFNSLTPAPHTRRRT